MATELAVPTVFAATVLDFAAEAPDRPAALARFDDLPQGMTLVLRARLPLDEVLLALREGRRGLFEWTPTLEGPWYWEVEVFRRHAAAPGLRRVGEALDWDHARLEALQRRTFGAYAQGRHETALRLYARFAHGLRRHMRIEEEIVLPELERRLRLDPATGPTSGVRADHRTIEGLLAEVASHPGAASLRSDGPAGELQAFLWAHEHREEGLIEKALERLLDEGESDALVAAMQSLHPSR
jgi:hypothetical protein